jgi:hypothetical protein
MSDRRHALDGDKQPLHEAVDIIRAQGKEKQPVLFDDVPQFANWYLPEFKTVNSDEEMPDWHVWYPFRDSGARVVSSDRKTYEISSVRLNKKRRMCVEKVWRVNVLNNAPQEEFSPDAFSPNGMGEDIMILGRACGK